MCGLEGAFVGPYYIAPTCREHEPAVGFLAKEHAQLGPALASTRYVIAKRFH
jgi:hypothetical protein